MKDIFGTHFDDDRYDSSKVSLTRRDGVVGTPFNQPYCTACGNSFNNCCCDDESGDREY